MTRSKCGVWKPGWTLSSSRCSAGEMGSRSKHHPPRLENKLKVSINFMLRRLLLGRKVMTNLDSIFKSRDITLPTKVRPVKAMVFPVVMYGCESWTVKKAECRRIDAFEPWCWRRLLRVPGSKEIQPVHSEGDQSWDFFGRNDAEAETPVLWPPHAKS